MRFSLLLLLAAGLWIASLRRVYDLSPAERSRVAEGILDRERALPPSPDMRQVNPEWDFMRRTFTVLALANHALAQPAERGRDLADIDRIVDDTIAAEAAVDGHFLLPYAKRGPFRSGESRSLFVDGEIAIMIGARDRVAPRPETREEGRRRAGHIRRAMLQSPSLSGESYPDECWTFCNTTALAALVVMGEPGDLPARWVDHARRHLIDDRTGLLVSSYTYQGTVLDGPEGSSLWMSIHNLMLIDEPFALGQYARARAALRGNLAGFGWAKEWPAAAAGRPDVDSGPIVPWLDASAGSSGLAFVGAAAAGDEVWLGELFASVELVGMRRGNRYLMSNDVGDAVLAYAASFGPLWSQVKDRGRTRS